MAIKFLNNIDVSGEVEGTSLDINGNADISGSLTITGAILNNVENASLDIYGGNDTTNDAHVKLHGSSNNYGSMELNYGYDATNSYFKVKQGSTENFVLQGGNATFAGTIGSGAITSTGKITGTELEGTSLDINGSGNLSGTLTIPGSFATTILDGDNVVVQKPNYSSGGWARALMDFKEHDDTSLYAIGAYGSNNTFSYGYIGTAYNNTTMRWAADKTVTFGGGVSIGGHTMNDIDVASEASNADDHLMSALAIKNRIEDFGYITSSGSTSGNAATATALATSRSIGGVSFNGTSAINLPGVNTSGNQDTSGTATNATNIGISDESSDTTCFPVFVTTNSGNRPAKVGTNLTFNSANGILAATGFNGALTGNVTGNVSGNAGGSAKGLSHLNAENAAIVGHGVIVGNADGDGIVQVTGNPTASNKFLRSRGAANANQAPTFESLTYSDLTGTVPTFNQNTTGTSAGLTGLTGSRVMVSAGNGTSSVSAITTTELGYLNDVTSNIQTQLNSKTGDQSQSDINNLAITQVGTISSGTWQGSAISTTYISNLDGTNTGDVCSSDHANAGYVTSSGITAVNDSNANTYFPIVFHDESNGLLDDTNGLEYNPSVGTLTVPEYIMHQGDGDTYIRFVDDSITIMMGDTNYTTMWNNAHTAVTSGILSSFGSDFVNHDSGLDLVTDDFSGNLGTYSGNSSVAYDRTTLQFHGDFLRIKNDHAGANKDIMLFDLNGRVGLNQTAPLFGIHDSRASGSNSDYYLVNGSMGLGTTPRAADSYIDVVGDVFTGVSDRRFKTDIRPYKNPIEKVKSLNGFTYKYNDLAKSIAPKTYGHDNDMAGVFAQEVQAVVPEAVLIAPCDSDEYGNSISGENYLTVNYEKLVPLLIEAIKEQQKQIEELKEKIDGNPS